MQLRRTNSGLCTRCRTPRFLLFLVLAVVLAGLALIGFRAIPGVFHPAPKPVQVITQSTLESIIGASRLSTFVSAYNGIAAVYNEKDPDSIDYYVSYEATVKAGIDFSQIGKEQIELNEETKTIVITLPPVTINQCEVDITSLEYIFLNNKANVSTVSQQAYKACEEDAKQESQQQKAIFTLAQENAVKFVQTMMEPLVQQLDQDYTLQVQPTV